MVDDKSSVSNTAWDSFRIGLGATSLVLLCACSTMGGEVSSAILSDTSDICYSQRQGLGRSNDYFTKDILVGAGVGAVTGVLGAAVTGHTDTKSLLIGTGAGAALGALGGYFIAKQKQNADTQTLANSVNADIAADNAQIDSATLAFANLRQCRFGAAKRVKDEYAAGQIPRDEAVRRLNDLQQRFNDDLILAREMDVKMSKRGQEFQYASDQLVKNDPQAQAAQPAIAEPEPPTRTGKKPRKHAGKSKRAPKSSTTAVAQATKTNLNKRQAFERGIEAASKQAASAFTLSGDIGWVWPRPEYRG